MRFLLKSTCVVSKKKKKCLKNPSHTCSPQSIIKLSVRHAYALKRLALIGYSLRTESLTTETLDEVFYFTIIISRRVQGQNLSNCKPQEAREGIAQCFDFVRVAIGSLFGVPASVHIVVVRFKFFYFFCFISL